ncbi:MAG: helix-turn-helix transcriptional regulator [Lachnospiraceae bacterium]|nr:helix-turn-helix transcriptional regulator [Lachnospiraceae bacterium]
MESLGNNIKRIRKQMGLTQEELSLQIGVTPQAVSRWENGTGMPDVSLIVPIAKALGISTDSLFGLESDKYDDSIYIELRRKIEQIEAESDSKADAALECCKFMLKKIYENPDNYIYTVYYVEQVANLSRYVHYDNFAQDKWPEYRELAIKYGSNAIRFSTEREWVERAHFALSWIYIHDGNYAYAREHIEQLPSVASNRLQESLLSQLAGFEGGIEKLEDAYILNLQHFVRAINKENYYSIQSFAWGSPEKAISYGEWALELMEKFSDIKELKTYCRGFLRDIYRLIIFAELRMNRVDDAVKHFNDLKVEMEKFYNYHQDVLSSDENKSRYNDRSIGFMEVYTKDFIKTKQQEIIDFVMANCPGEAADSFMKKI